MKRYLLTRLAGGLATLLVSAVVVFAVVRLIPGSPISKLLDRQFDPTVAASLQRLYGLDKPIPVQFWTWITAVLHGDLGYSLLSSDSVASIVGERIPRTLILLAGGVTVGLLIAVPAGVIAATRRGRYPDAAVSVGTTLLLSVPQFWLGILLTLVFAINLRVLPAIGYVDPAVDPAGAFKALILPWLTIGLPMAAYVSRVLRSSLLEVLGQDYLRAARARGVREDVVIMRHALRNAAIPTVTVVGLEIGYLLGGSIVVEQVFSYPGMGQLMINAIVSRDYPVIQASILFFAVAFVVVNLITDVIYATLDPRIRTGTA